MATLQQPRTTSVVSHHVLLKRPDFAGILCSQIVSAVVKFEVSQMASPSTSLVRAAKRSRTMGHGMGLNPMLMGMNPMLMSLFNQSMGHMLPEEDECEEPEVVQTSVAPASSVAAPKATPPAPATQGPPDDNHHGDDEEFHNLSPDASISRSITYLKQAPKNRLSEALEAVCPSLDATLTAQLSVPGMLAVLWTYTRILPTTKISDLSPAAAIILIA